MAKESKAMIIEYLYNDRCVKHTYKNVTNVETGGGKVTCLYGTTPAELDKDGRLTQYARPFFIAAINLAPGEYLERVDVPRD